MSYFILYVTTAFALIFVIEGLFYALFPEAVRRMMAMAVMMPVKNLRVFGLVMAISGVCMMGLLRVFSGS